MTQFYIIEIKQLSNGEYEHEVSWAFDADADAARLKGESTYYDKLSKAAVSNYAQHSVTLISDEGFPVMNKCYKHNVQPEPEPTPEPEPVEEPIEEE